MSNKLQHLALIMDGNRRWAKLHVLAAHQGHEKGSEVAYEIAKACIARDITHLTMWVFSAENWKRTTDEINFIMRLIELSIRRRLEEFTGLGARLNHIGNPEGLPESLVATIRNAESQSQHNCQLVLNMAINYSGEDELQRAMAKMVDPVPLITQGRLRNYLDTAGQPDVDLVIRTGGQHRLSGFMPLQTVWSELYFTDTLWPDFSEQELDKAIGWFNKQERNFGK
ncbi:di-trans,poly-cis-decaprenylcistransferase [Candidatus Berkelbacteria bacterium]|nr:di-trans,poly-cis-decaprenylcistransferase [Candidatus Berkelbacteria bacterium]